jgi:CheY-like chemotaxis protein
VLGRNCRFLQGARTDRATVRQIGKRWPTAPDRGGGAELPEGRHAVLERAVHRPGLRPGRRLLHFFSSQFDATRRHDAEEALRRAQKMEAIGRLAAGLAHDFNNALHVVLGNLGRVEARLPDEADARTALGRAKRAGEHVAALTRQLLAFARRSGLDPRPVALNAVLAGSGEALSRVLGEGVELRFDLDPGLPPCVADPARVEAALLTCWPTRATPCRRRPRHRAHRDGVLDEAAVVGRGRRAAAGPLRGARGGGRGAGHAARGAGARGEPFFTTKAGKGTGLGLATVHGFVRQSGGRLEIRQRAGPRHAVRMLFPRRPATAEAPPPPPKAEAVLDTEGGTETVLVVDDDAGVLDLAVHHLTALGYRVLSARGGEEALEVLGARKGGWTSCSPTSPCPAA